MKVQGKWFLVVALMSFALLSQSELRAEVVMPPNFKLAKVEDLKAYLLSTLTKKRVGLQDMTSPIYNGDDMVRFGKESLSTGDYKRADVFFFVALTLDPNNQKAAFWRAFTILTANPQLEAQVKEFGLVDSKGNIAFNADMMIPRIIEFKKISAVTLSVVDQIKESSSLLNRVSRTFKDEVSEPTLGSATIDYAAVLAMKAFLANLEGMFQYVNAYDTDFAQLSAKELGSLYPEDFAGVTNDSQSLYNDLMTEGFIGADRKVQNLFVELNKDLKINFWHLEKYSANGEGEILLYSALSPNDYLYYPQLTKKFNSNMSCSFRFTTAAKEDNIIGIINAKGLCEAKAFISRGQSYNVIANINDNGRLYSKSKDSWGLYSITALDFIKGPSKILGHPKQAKIYEILKNAYESRLDYSTLFNFYPRLGAMKADTQQRLNASRQAFSNALNQVSLLVTYLRQREATDGLNYLIKNYRPLDPMQIDRKSYLDNRQKALSLEADFQQYIKQVRANLNNQLPYVIVPNNPDLSVKSLVGQKVNFLALFTPKDLRSAKKIYDQELTKGILSNDFYDPYMKELFPDIKNEQVNLLMGWGSADEIQSVKVLKDEKAIEVKWSQNLYFNEITVSYDLIRSLTGQWNDPNAVVVARLGKGEKSYRDSNVDFNQKKYYYFLVQNLKLSNGRDAKLTQTPFEVKLNEETPNSLPVIFSVPTQRATLDKALTFTITVVDADRDDQINITLANSQEIPGFAPSFTTQVVGNARLITVKWSVPVIVNNGSFVAEFAINDGRSNNQVIKVPVVIDSASIAEYQLLNKGKKAASIKNQLDSKKTTTP